jgi:hypothetical protein
MDAYLHTHDAFSKYTQSQAISNILNGFSRLEVRDPALFDHLCEATLKCPINSLCAQGVANTVNALAKFSFRHVKCLEYLTDAMVKELIPASISMHRQAYGHKNDRRGFDPQAVANVANAYARLELPDQRLFSVLAEQVLVLPARVWDPQALALVLNAYAKADLFNEPLFRCVFIHVYIVKCIRVLKT